MAVGTFEGDVIIVDARTQRTLRTFHAHDRYAQVLFLRGGRLVTSGQDGPVLLWDTKTARLIKTISKGTDYSGSLAASQDGKRIAFSDFKTIQIVDVDSGRQLAVPAKPISDDDDNIRCLALSPDGRKAAWGTWLGDVAVWDVDRGTIVWSERIPGQIPRDHSGGHTDFGGTTMVGTLSFSPDGRQLAIGGREGLIIVSDALTGRRLSSDSNKDGSLPENVYALAFLPDGRSLVAGYSYGLIRRVSVPEGREVFFHETGVDGILDVAASPDGKRIYSLQNGGFLGINDAETGAGLIDGMNRTILSAAYSPDGKQLAGAGSDGVIQIFSMPGGKPLRSMKANAKAVSGLGFSHDGKMLGSMGKDNVIRIWSSTSSAPFWEAAVEHPYVGNLAFTPDDGSLLAGDGRSIDAWDVRSGAKLRRIGEHPEPFGGLAISPDGKYAATACYDGRAYLWDLRSGARIFAKPEHPYDITNAEDVAFTPNGRELIFRDRREYKLFRYSVPDGRLLETRQLPFTSKMFLSPDGKSMILSEPGGGIGHWTTSASVSDSDGRARAIFPDLAGVGDVVAVSPDGGFLATAGDDGVLRIWPIPPLD